MDRIGQPCLRPDTATRLTRGGRRAVPRAARGRSRLRRIAVWDRLRHRRLDPDPGPVLRRLRAQALLGAGPDDWQLPPERWRERPHAGDRADRPPRRGPDGGSADHRRARRRRPIRAEIELGDPAGVSLEGLRVVIAENSAWRPMSRDLHDAREAAAGALAAGGARLARIDLSSWRGALLPFLTTLEAGSGSSTSELLTAAGTRAPTTRRLLTPGGQHTMATRLTLALRASAGPRAWLGPSAQAAGARARTRRRADRPRSATGCSCIPPTADRPLDTAPQSAGHGC